MNILHCDAAVSGEIDAASYAAVLNGKVIHGSVPIEHMSKVGLEDGTKIHMFTSQSAERYALIHGLNQAIMEGIKELEVYGDNSEVYHRLSVPNYLALNTSNMNKCVKYTQFLKDILELCEMFDYINFNYVHRSENTIADYWAKAQLRALESGIEVETVKDMSKKDYRAAKAIHLHSSLVNAIAS
jgi:ribonuclease HI